MPLPRTNCRTARLSVLALLLALPLSSAVAQEPAPALQFGVGWSVLHLNDIEFTARTNDIVTEVVGHETDHDGELNGYKVTGELSGLMPRHHGSWLMTVAAKGFYSRYEDEQQSQCLFTPDSDCIFVPLVDPDPTTPSLGNVAGGILSDWRTTVEREAVYWGAALEFDFNRHANEAVSLKEAAPVEPSSFQWRAGLSVRRLTQDSSLFSIDLGPAQDPVTLSEDLDTSYYGGYVGFTTWKSLDHGLRVKLAGETGLYYADTDYQGIYSSTASLAGPPVGPQALELSDSAPAFIGLLNVALERDFGSATFAIFGEAEWMSYVPKVLYNETDLNGGVPFDIVGVQNGTELGDGSAISYTVGARVTVPLR